MNESSHLDGKCDEGGLPRRLLAGQCRLWESYYACSRNLFGRSPSDLAREYLEVFGPQEGTILDLGCGEGRDSILFGNQGHDAVGLDFSHRAVRSARDDSRHLQRRIRFVVADMARGSLPFADVAFGGVFSHDGLHYFDDAITSRLFADIRRVVAEDGVFGFSVKSVRDPQWGEGIEIEPNFFVLNGHARHFFDVQYAQEKLRGFEVLRMEEMSREFGGRTSTFIECICLKH
jgi:SAM-dependent methyltransferase